MGGFRIVLALIVLGPLAVWLFVSAITALRGGQANAAGTIVDRGSRPAFFTLTVFAQLAFAALAITLLISILADWFRPAP